jgi:TatD DNase family protein
LFDERYKATEKEQDAVFAQHIRAAVRSGLPLVLHVRRAMHKILAVKKDLARVSAVVFHAYSGSAEDMEQLLAAGVNGYFSFGSAIVNNHKRAVEACARCPASRLLFETDAPYQPLNLRLNPGCGLAEQPSLSRYADIAFYIKRASLIRKEDAAETERVSDENWDRVFPVQPQPVLQGRNPL